MKHKQVKLVFFFLLMVMVYHLTAANVVLGVEEKSKIDELVPNDYQKEKFKINKDLILDKQQQTQRTTIPEEQKELTFEGEKVSNDREVKHNLFSSDAKDLNTIKAKAVSMQLFSEKELLSQSAMEEETDSSSASPLSLLIWILVAICSILLIVVLFVWNKSTTLEKRV
ncbi:type VII secretion protein EssA [Metabacillus crassostreae]|uniref:type VII secretion protein EssA n=1 Tax=Metabacillus crassostreae TaxID=929098 RepID=UPI0019580F2E|nr:type VII secretion protein EssA [Metabacillus crassostreae]MBM7605173.1 type VII secretion protein EssA [Metabacillus crassostreae]